MSLPATILLIEDNPRDATILSDALAAASQSDTELDFELECVESLESGLDALDVGKYSAVLLELSLSGSHGVEKLERIHKRALNSSGGTDGTE